MARGNLGETSSDSEPARSDPAPALVEILTCELLPALQVVVFHVRYRGMELNLPAGPGFVAGPVPAGLLDAFNGAIGVQPRAHVYTSKFQLAFAPQLLPQPAHPP
ncbi:hypothetical protein AURDEDRAFT_155496 [Auricularia subglabra TFB-10046 SS5]|nr:hypothetical protein AURDEDRAFT_155496 [Auricularia subglabra TFB-10046 SS5]